MARERAAHGLDGVIVLAKPSGPTSHDVVALVRRLTGTRRVGHGGTLDPFASGVLPVFLGLATRLVEYHMGDSKAYRATVCFGARSTTDDRDGELEPSEAPAPTRAELEAALVAFRGQIDQRPPAYSALKVGGRRAYQLAREGVTPELALRKVTIERLDLVEWDASDPDRPVAVLHVECSAGTYVRSLARDLGDRLGCGAYLGGLVRTASGPFKLKAARTLDDLREAAAGSPTRLSRLVLPVDAGLEHIPTLALAPDEVEAIARGQQVRPHRRPHLEQGELLRLLDGEGRLVGMANWKAGRLVPDKVFVTPPPRPPRPAAEGATPAGSGAPRQEAAAPRRGEPRIRVPLPEGCLTVVNGIDALRPELGPLYVSVGVFDGLHRGHLYLLRHLRRAARRAGARPAVVTFDAHPDEVLHGSAPPLICDPGERLVRLAASGVEVAVVQHFDAALRETPYDRFVAMLRERVAIAGFLMTPDAAFGYERRGTPEALQALGEREGFEVAVVPPLLLDGEPVRSSQVRAEIAATHLDRARRLLGRPPSATGSLTSPDAAGLIEEGGVEGMAAPDASCLVQFELPVALPPPGRYVVLVGPAWAPGLPPLPAVEERLAEVSAGSVTILGAVPGDGVPSDARVRVVFMAPVAGGAARRAAAASGAGE